MNNSGRALLILGAGANFLIAALHLVIIFVGAPAYLYFGAADLARMADRLNLTREKSHSS